MNVMSMIQSRIFDIILFMSSCVYNTFYRITGIGIMYLLHSMSMRARYKRRYILIYVRKYLFITNSYNYTDGVCIVYDVSAYYLTIHSIKA